MKLREQFSPRFPDLFTQEELDSYKIRAYKATGKMALGPAGMLVLVVGAITENLPASIAGLAVASYGLLSGTHDTYTLSETEREVNKRPQNTSLPLEYFIES